MAIAHPQKGIDRTLLAIVLILVVGGFLIFSSASLGLLARNGASFSSVAFNQFVFGVVGGLFAEAFEAERGRAGGRRRRWLGHWRGGGSRGDRTRGAAAAAAASGYGKDDRKGETDSRETTDH